MMTPQVAYNFSISLFCENEHVQTSFYLGDSVAEAFTLELLLQNFQIQ